MAEVESQTSDKRLRALPALIVAGVCVVLGARLFSHYLLYGHSADIDAFRLLAFDAALRAEDLYPRWTPYWYFGHGSPIFHFYAPLPYYVAEIPLLLGASIPRALQFTLFATWLASGAAMYLFARDRLSRPAATLAAALYALAPYHLVDMLVRHALGEHIAFVWIPLALWGLTGLVRAWSPVRFAASALAVAALPLTHNITAMIGLPLIAAWCADEWLRTKNHKGAATAVAATLLGLALSAFFWLPAFVEKADVYAAENLTADFFHYANHFVAPWQLFSPVWGFGGSRPGTAEDAMSFQVGLVHWVFMALAIGVIVARRTNPGVRRLARHAAVPAAAFAGAALMTTALTKPIWDAAGLLSFVQFPWRFLALAAVGSSWLAACAVDLMEPDAGREKWTGAVAGIICALAAYGAYTTPRFGAWDVDQKYLAAGTRAQVAEWLASGTSRKDVNDLLTLESLKASGQKGTSWDDYLPRTAERAPDGPAEALFGLQPDATFLKEERLGLNRYRFKFSLPTDGEVSFRQFFFAGWTATLDGREIPIRVVAPYGTMAVDVPPGDHALEFRFAATPLRAFADALSMSAVLALLVALLPRRPRRNR